MPNDADFDLVDVTDVPSDVFQFMWEVANAVNNNVTALGATDKVIQLYVVREHASRLLSYRAVWRHAADTEFLARIVTLSIAQTVCRFGAPDDFELAASDHQCVAMLRAMLN